MKLSYETILRGPSSNFLDYNVFSVDVFDGSNETKYVRNHMINTFNLIETNAILEHIASHLEILNENSCAALIKGLSKIYASDRFIMILSKAASNSELLRTFIKNGADENTIKCVIKTSGDPTLNFLIDDMKLMTEKLNVDIFKVFLQIKSEFAYTAKMIQQVKPLIKPITVKNMADVTRMINLINDTPRLLDSSKNSHWASMCD